MDLSRQRPAEDATEAERKRLQETLEGLADIAAGDVVEGEEVLRRLETWGTAVECAWEDR